MRNHVMNNQLFKVYDPVSKALSHSFSLFGEFTMLGAFGCWLSEVRNESTSELSALADIIQVSSSGRIDINNNPVFAGDIVRITQVVGNGDNPPKSSVHLVTFSPMAGCYTNTGRADRISRGIDQIEVIGNVFENPEFGFSIDMLTEQK